MKWIKLSNREIEVLYCLADGLTTEQAAKRMFLSSETVKSHRHNLMQKLDAKNAFHLAVIAMQNGFLNYPAMAS